MKTTPWVLVLLNLLILPSAGASGGLDLADFCRGQASTGEENPSLKLVTLPEDDLLFLDRGFCSIFTETQKNDASPGSWKIRFYQSYIQR
jgi:hypothetical protein